MKSRYLLFLVAATMIPGLAFADDFEALQKQILLLIQQVVSLQQQLSTLRAINSIPCYSFTANLGLGDVGDDVQKLQVMLEREGTDLRSEKAKKSYGEKTASAVTGFQEKYKSEILTPLGFSYGTGYFGEATRKKFNSIYGCGAKPPDLSRTPAIRAQNAVEVSNPKPNSAVGSSFKISGLIKNSGWIGPKGEPGNVEIYDSSGIKIGRGALKAISDWKKLPVYFEGSASLSGQKTDYGSIVISSVNSNISRDINNFFRLPVQFSYAPKGSIAVLSPDANDQWNQDRQHAIQWRGGSSKVNLSLISRAAEESGAATAVVWRANNVSNSGIYTITVPINLLGDFRVHITDGGSFGNSPYIRINPPQSNVGFPSITRINGPTLGSVKQNLEWSVAAVSPAGRPLTFRAAWGDGSSGYAGVVAEGKLPTDGKTARFAHAYAVNGTYTITFTATTDLGASAQGNYVVDITSPNAPSITGISPSEGPAGTVVTLTGNRFAAANTIYFGDGTVSSGARSSNGKTLTFKNSQDAPGNYEIYVQNSGGKTNKVIFKVIPPPSCDNNPGTGFLNGCYYKWPSLSSIPRYPEDGIVGGPAARGMEMPSPVSPAAMALDLDWGNSTPANALVGHNNFLAKWRGNFTFNPGTYVFTAGSDDGIRVKVNGDTKLDKWTKRTYAENAFSYIVATRETILIEIEYFVDVGTARVKFGWTKQ